MSYEASPEPSIDTLRIPPILRGLRFEDDSVSFVPLKDLARRLLPSGSTLQGIILAQLDWLPRSEALPKLDIFVQLLYKEVGKV